MKKNKLFKIGDKIVRFGRVHKIFDIKDKDKEKIIFFKPYFKRKYGQTLVCSIPIRNISKTGIRKLLSKKKLQELFRELSLKSEERIRVDLGKARQTIKSNNPFEIAGVLRNLWLEKKDKTQNFTKSRKEVFKLSVKKLVEEVAFVSDVSLRKAKAKIREALERN